MTIFDLAWGSHHQATALPGTAPTRDAPNVASPCRVSPHPGRAPIFSGRRDHAVPSAHGEGAEGATWLHRPSLARPNVRPTPPSRPVVPQARRSRPVREPVQPPT